VAVTIHTTYLMHLSFSREQRKSENKVWRLSVTLRQHIEVKYII